MLWNKIKLPLIGCLHGQTFEIRFALRGLLLLRLLKLLLLLLPTKRGLQLLFHQRVGWWRGCHTRELQCALRRVELRYAGQNSLDRRGHARLRAGSHLLRGDVAAEHVEQPLRTRNTGRHVALLEQHLVGIGHTTGGDCQYRRTSGRKRGDRPGQLR